MDFSVWYYIILALSAVVFAGSFLLFARKKTSFAIFGFVCGGVVAASARSVLVIYAVDPATGFSIYKLPVALFAVLLLVTGAAIFFAERRNKTEMGDGAPAFLRYAALLTAAAGFALIGWQNAAAAFSAAKISFLPLATAFTAAGAVIAMIVALPAFDRSRKRESAIWFLMPALCVALVLIKSFIEHIMVASVSEYFYDVAMFCVVMIFCFSDARARAGFGARGEVRYSGLCAVVIIMVDVLPKLLFSAIGNSGLFITDFSLLYCGFLLLLPYAALRLRDAY